jgi:type IV fimbrial biogenesis protein FimT
MKTFADTGFTLIELLIAMALFAVLIAIAGPMFGQFLTNSQIRNAAETSFDGVRLAQQGAIKQNLLAQFVLIPPTGWIAQVQDEDHPTGAYFPLQSYDRREGAPRVSLKGHPANAVMVTFNGLGRVVPNPDGTPSLSWIEVFNTNGSTGFRPLNVVISATDAAVTTFTGTKICDPDTGVATTDPRHCPALIQ